MKVIKNLTFAAVALTLVFHAPIMRAGDHSQPAAPSNPFVTLLEGIFEPVPAVPDIGLSQDINDLPLLKKGFFYVFCNVPGPTDKVAGTFYVQFPVGDLC